MSHLFYVTDYFNDVLTTSMGLKRGSCVAVYGSEGQKALGFHQKYLNLCSKDEKTSYGFGTTWAWVMNYRIKIFGWTIPLNICLDMSKTWICSTLRSGVVPCKPSGTTMPSYKKKSALSDWRTGQFHTKPQIMKFEQYHGLLLDYSAFI